MKLVIHRTPDNLNKLLMLSVDQLHELGYKEVKCNTSHVTMKNEEYAIEVNKMGYGRHLNGCNWTELLKICKEDIVSEKLMSQIIWSTSTCSMKVLEDNGECKKIHFTFNSSYMQGKTLTVEYAKEREERALLKKREMLNKALENCTYDCFDENDEEDLVSISITIKKSDVTELMSTLLQFKSVSMTLTDV